MKTRNPSDENKGKKLTSSLSENLEQLGAKIMDCPDIVQRKLYIDGKREACILFIDNTINLDLLQRDFIRPIQAMSFQELRNEQKALDLPGAAISTHQEFEPILTVLFTGEAVFLCDGIGFAISCMLSDTEQRGIEEPVTEKNIRGAHEGFVESIKTNLSILRRKAKNHRLKFKQLTLGTVTNQKAAIAYLDGITDPKLLSTLYEKIKKVNYDGILANGYIEQAITDFPNSPFPQYLATERPEKVLAALLEGRLAVLLEGTPVVIIAPVSFFSFFQALDDYSNNWINASLLRFLRLASLFTALFLPSLYIAITSYHYYAVPLNLLVTLGESRARVPFPPIIEVLILEATVEMVREAAIRLPTYIGTSISVVAGLIIGQAAVEAGVVSNLLIVIVASTAIASYVIPSYDMGLAIRILRFAFLLAAAFFGIIGIIVCTSFFLVHAITLESLGKPYYQPIIPLRPADLKDTFLRFPLSFMRSRPKMAKPKDMKRGKRND